MRRAMDVRSFPRVNPQPRAGDHCVDIDYLLTLTNFRLVRMTGNPDVVETRLGLRKLRSLGLKALVCGTAVEGFPAEELASANDDSAN